MLERTLAIKERHYGLDHPEMATTLTSLGGAYYSLGETQKSRELLERALTINERHYGLEHSNMAKLTNLLSLMRLTSKTLSRFRFKIFKCIITLF